MSEPAIKFLQVIVVSGTALRRLQAATDIEVKDPRNNTIVMRGVGDYFPMVEGLDWAAGCGPHEAGDPIGLSDLGGILRFLMNQSLILATEAPSAEITAWLRGNSGDAR
jgi:hypothetical protein